MCYSPSSFTWTLCERVNESGVKKNTAVCALILSDRGAVSKDLTN